VTSRVGYDPFREDASVLVSIHVGGSAKAVDGRVGWWNASGTSLGERNFVARDGDCLRLLAEMSFAVGLQIGLLRRTGSSVTETPSGAATAARPTVTATPPVASASPSSTATPGAGASPPPHGRPATESPLARVAIETEHPSNENPAERLSLDAPSRWRMWVGFGPSIAWGISPAVTADARLFLAVRHDDLSAEIAAEASYPSTELQWDGTGFRQRLIGATSAVCGHRRALSVCAVGKASQVRVSGLGVDNPRSPTGVAVQAGVRLAGTMQLKGPWSAVVHLDALGLLTPYMVDLNQDGVWQMPRIGGLAGIDVFVRLR
jgi:hypothetical protein